MTAPTPAAAAYRSYRLCAVQDIPPGEGRAFVAGSEQVAVFRRRDGSLAALSAVCPHAGGPLADGQIDRRVVWCPLHLNAFELDTGWSPTGQPSVAAYPVRVENGQVVVDVPDTP